MKVTSIVSLPPPCSSPFAQAKIAAAADKLRKFVITRLLFHVVPSNFVFRQKEEQDAAEVTLSTSATPLALQFLQEFSFVAR
jgi:hypothetical protein